MANEKQSNFTNLYVKNFGQDIDESKLCQLFSVYGPITSCKIQTNNNGQSKGFGFVDFERPEMAKNALEKLNGCSLEDGKTLYVAPFQKKSERQNELRRIHKQSNNICLYISNLDSMVDEKILEAIFTKFGQVTGTHILRNGNQSKGIGFVCFNTIEERARALSEMNGKWILSKPIYVKLSKRTDNSLLTTFNSPKSSTHPTPYLNSPTMFYVSTIMVPSPSNNLPLPIFPLPSPSSTTHINRQVYPYHRVKFDDQ